MLMTTAYILFTKYTWHFFCVATIVYTFNVENTEKIQQNQIHQNL